MQERRRGDISGPHHGDWVDWDNPEDLEDDTPEGYYDEEEDDDSYIPGRNDPDYDLSEEAGYAGYEPSRRAGVFPQWVIVAVSLLLIMVILTPVVLRLS
jgi:hypothetical protein